MNGIDVSQDTIERIIKEYLKSNQTKMNAQLKYCAYTAFPDTKLASVV